MKVIPLGTNGYVSSFNRQTACYVIPFEDQLIILDAGSGLFRFMEPVGRQLLKGRKKVKIFLSHYHLDHTFGFYAAFELFTNQKVEVYAYDDKPIFRELVYMFQFPVDFDRKHKNFKWIKVTSQKYKNEGFDFSVRIQKHRNEKSLGFRFEFAGGKKLAYVTDADPSRESVNFVKGADLLLHEHETLNVPKYKNKSKLEDLISEGGHVTTEGAALVAKEAGVGKLFLIHHNPPCDRPELVKDLQKAKKIFPASFMAKDLEEIEF